MHPLRALAPPNCCCLVCGHSLEYFRFLRVLTPGWVALDLFLVRINNVLRVEGEKEARRALEHRSQSEEEVRPVLRHRFLFLVAVRAEHVACGVAAGEDEEEDRGRPQEHWAQPAAEDSCDDRGGPVGASDQHRDFRNAEPRRGQHKTGRFHEGGVHADEPLDRHASGEGFAYCLLLEGDSDHLQNEGEEVRREDGEVPVQVLVVEKAESPNLWDQHDSSSNIEGDACHGREEE
mmetsp:Transcript_70456/g.147509  ORF Transcript_70456/g.147509 Transcript_70456/m.147509 type:complete len:234 (-) Transcript_70456:1234-1935(-)